MTAEQVRTLLQVLGYIFGLLGLVSTGVFGVLVARQNRRARQDRTPETENQATQIANDLIFRLLDKANDEVTRYQGLLATVSTEAEQHRSLAALVPRLQNDLDRAIIERDRLRKAIHYLEAKARIVGHLTYAEVVAWASLALDPDADPAVFDRNAYTLPDGVEDTVTTM